MDDTKTLRCAFYIRVSTDQQIDGVSLEAQEQALFEFIQRNPGRYTINKSKHIFIDAAFSGKTDIRPEFQRLMECGSNREFDIILVWKLDRFFRNLGKAITHIEELNRYDVSIKSITQEFDTSGAFGKAIFNIMMAFAELESNLIRERSMLGKSEKARQGKYVGGGIPPYGYYLDSNRVLFVEESEKLVVQKIFSMFLDENKGVTEISEYLTTMEYPIKNVKGKGKKNPDGSEKTGIEGGVSYLWTSSYLYSILKNNMYYGEYYYGKNSVGKGNISKKDLQEIKEKKKKGDDIDMSHYKPKELLVIPCPPLINDSRDVSKEIFDKVQIKLKEGRNVNKRGMQHYIFSGKLFSGEGKFRYTGYVNSSLNVSYRLQRDKSKPNYEKKGVSSIGEKELVGKVMGFVQDMISCPHDKLANLFSSYQEGADKIQDREDELAAIKKRKEEFLRKKDIMYEDRLSERITYQEFERFNEKNKHDLELLENREAEIGYQIQVNKKNLVNATRLKEIFEKFKVKIATLTYKEQAELCELVVNKVIIYKDTESYLMNFSSELYDFFKGDDSGESSTKSGKKPPSKPKNGGKGGKGGETPEGEILTPDYGAKTDGGGIGDSYAIQNSLSPLYQDRQTFFTSSRGGKEDWREEKCIQYRKGQEYRVWRFSPFLFPFSINMPREISFVSYNIRTSRIDESILNNRLNNWQYRKQEVFNIIHRQLPDIFGVQEDSREQLQDLTERFSDEYSVIAFDASIADENIEHNAIFISKEFPILESGFRFISDTPEIPSKLPESIFHRHLTYARILAHGKEWLIINVHMDHSEDYAFKHVEAECLLRVLEGLGTYDNLIFFGDFNMIADDNEAYKTLASKLVDVSKVRQVREPTHPHWGMWNVYKQIDYFWLSQNLKESISDFTIVKDKYLREDGFEIEPSDHFLIRFVLGA